MRATNTSTPAWQQQQHHSSSLLTRPPPPRPQRRCRLHCAASSDRQQPSSNPVFSSSKQQTSPFSSSSSSAVLQTQQQDPAGRQAGAGANSWKAAGMSEHTFQWRGNSIHYVTAGCGKPVLLVHGFGASCGHYRRTIPFLAQNGYKVCHSQRWHSTHQPTVHTDATASAPGMF
jgi:hypothetical protein